MAQYNSETQSNETDPRPDEGIYGTGAQAEGPTDPVGETTQVDAQGHVPPDAPKAFDPEFFRDTTGEPQHLGRRTAEPGRGDGSNLAHSHELTRRGDDTRLPSTREPAAVPSSTDEHSTSSMQLGIGLEDIYVLEPGNAFKPDEDAKTKNDSEEDAASGEDIAVNGGDQEPDDKGDWSAPDGQSDAEVNGDQPSDTKEIDKQVGAAGLALARITPGEVESRGGDPSSKEAATSETGGDETQDEGDEPARKQRIGGFVAAVLQRGRVQIELMRNSAQGASNAVKATAGDRLDDRVVAAQRNREGRRAAKEGAKTAADRAKEALDSKVRQDAATVQAAIERGTPKWMVRQLRIRLELEQRQIAVNAGLKHRSLLVPHIDYAGQHTVVRRLNGNNKPAQKQPAPKPQQGERGGPRRNSFGNNQGIFRE